MKQQALPVGDVGIDFEMPAGLAHGRLQMSSESGLQLALHPFAAGLHQLFETRLALLFARGRVRRGVTAETECLLVHDEIDVLRKALDQFPRFRERSAAFESEVLANPAQAEKFTERPADPEILFHAHRLQSHRRIDLLEGEPAPLGGSF